MCSSCLVPLLRLRGCGPGRRRRALRPAPTERESCETPPLDVMAIDNLPSLLPRESSEDFAAQLLPHLRALDQLDAGVWGRAATVFRDYLANRL